MNGGDELVLMLTIECTTVEEVHGSQPGEHDHDPSHDVDHEVVGGRHDGRHHRQRAGDGKAPEERVARGPEDGDADQDVPAGVEAGHRRVLVDELRRHELPVALGVPRHRVDER